MKKIISLIINDLRNVFRDPALIAMFVVPVIIILLLVFGLPRLVDYVPEFGEYTTVILAFFSAMTALFAAFVISFIMLDEKDQKLFDVIKVMPISKATFVVYRLSFIFFYSFLYSIAMILITGIIKISFIKVIILAMLFGLLGPIIALTVITFARNKIEGVTMLKGVSFAILLPLLGFFLTSSWKYLLGVIPVYWSYAAFANTENASLFYLYAAIGVVLHLLYTYVIYKQFVKRVF